MAKHTLTLDSIRARLMAAKVPVAAIAEEAKVSERNLYYIINGRHSPRWKTLEAVYGALNRLSV